MMIEFRLPDVGEGIHEAEIIRWLVEEGQRVREFEPIVEVQTDKAVVELPAPATGCVQRIHVPEGELARVGDVLVSIQRLQDGAPSGESSGGQRSNGIAKGNRSGKPVEDEPAASVRESTRGDTDAERGELGFGVRSLTAQVPTATPSMQAERRVRATPAVRHYARKMSVPLSEVDGSGRGGRILKEDIDRYVSLMASSQANALQHAGARQTDPIRRMSTLEGQHHGDVSPLMRAIQPLLNAQHLNGQHMPVSSAMDESTEQDSLRRPVYESPRPNVQSFGSRFATKVPFRGIRRATAEHVKRAAFTAPHVTAFDDCDASALIELRNRWNKALEARGQRLSYLPFLIKATVSALKAFPYFNARLNEEEQCIELLPEYHIGIAMDTPEGLLVPVIRNAEELSVVEIGQEIYRLTQAAKKRTLKSEELRGSTFTITNMGPIGGLFATPILNYPEVGILAIHQIKRRPVVRDEQIVIGDVLTLSLSFDHRVIDGAMSVRFMNHMKHLIEHPELLMMELR
jgi:pyruvate/2-oxoglutarate dehydrogenase complex dihydrolipoamide acyltransferase (E2) component